MTGDKIPRIRCRLIAEADIPEIADLLTQGFPDRSMSYWAGAMEKLAQRQVPAGYPRFGYMLDCGGRPVGVILMIFSAGDGSGAAKARCNISSWYVDPLYKAYASLLIAAAVRLKDVVYINLSPAPHTWTVIEAQGFRRYCEGQILALPALGPWKPGVTVREFSPHQDYSLSEKEREILESHQTYGCLSLVVEDKVNCYPFVFLERRMFRDLLPALQLVYCRELGDYVRFSGALGRKLLRRGRFLAIVDSNGPLPGLIGFYRPNRGPKYFKGPECPRLGDVSFSESVLFGP